MNVPVMEEIGHKRKEVIDQSLKRDKAMQADRKNNVRRRQELNRMINKISK
jgi:hypothetical protein